MMIRFMAHVWIPVRFFCHFSRKKNVLFIFLPTQTPPPMAQAPGTDISLMAIKAQIPVVRDLKVLQHLLNRTAIFTSSGSNFFQVFDVML